MRLILVTAAYLTILVAPTRGQSDLVLAPNEGDVLLLTGFGAELTPSLLPTLWDTEGIYVVNRTSRVRQWRHSTRPNLVLAYEPITAGPNSPRRWIILDVGPNEDLLNHSPPLAELPRAGPRPWQRRGGGWLARDCTGVLRETPAQLIAVDDLRRRDRCATLAWRLVGLGERHPHLAPLAGRFRATDVYSAGAPVYRSDSGAELRRVVSNTSSSWVLHVPDDSRLHLAALADFADRINYIRTEQFLAATLPGQDFRDRPAFVCEPDGWATGDTDFQLPDLDGYTTLDDPNGQARWSRQQFSDEDRKAYELAFGDQPDQNARLMAIENVTRTSMNVISLSLQSPRVQLTYTSCAVFRIRNDGFHVTVTLRKDNGTDQILMKDDSRDGWQDILVPLPGSGSVTLDASRPNGDTDGFAVSHVFMYNKTCHQLPLLGRVSVCQDVTCHNGGKCRSVTSKHHLCLCPPGFIGAQCEVRVGCGQPPEIDFGRVIHISGTTYLDRTYYRCLPGHQHAETVFGLAWGSCHYDGSWVNIPRCESRMDQEQPYIECSFGDDCAGFNMRVDNAYNTATDEEWQLGERLHTSNIRPRRSFLSVYRSRGRRQITARLLTPCLDLQDPGCLQLDFHLTNATLQMHDWPSGRMLFHTTEGGRRRLIQLKQRVGPLLVVVQLMDGESEAALDAIRVFRATCQELAELKDDEKLTWPTWPLQQQEEGLVNRTQRKEANAASTNPSDTSPLILVLVPLLVLFGIVMVLRYQED